MEGFIPIFDKEGCRIVHTSDITVNGEGLDLSLQQLYTLLGVNIVEALALSPDHRLIMDEEGLLKAYDFGFKVKVTTQYADPDTRAKCSLPPLPPSINLVGSICIVQIDEEGYWQGFKHYSDAYAYCVHCIEVNDGSCDLLPNLLTENDYKNRFPNL